ncbi:MAG: hypothetical protein FP825_06090 [Hyphomonas sp.]|nr:hypothetical protein [Hyphomonas sp.]
MPAMKPLAALLASGLSLLTLAACTAPGAEIEPLTAEPAPAAALLWQAETAAGAIRAASCPPGDSAPQAFQTLPLTAAPLTPKQADVLSGRLPAGARLAGAWELGADDPNFGGLSGLAVEDEASLLAVTDAGGWVRIALTGGAPASASIAYMRGAGGKFLHGKLENDAEGLAYRDGVAYVSFERDFRIEAFAIGTCGAAAKAVEIAALPAAFEGKPLDANEGPEALTLTPEGHLRFGFEGASTSVSPVGRVLADGSAAWSGARAANPAGFALVGMDSVRLSGGTDLDITLFRAFDPLRGARSVLRWGPGEAGQLALSRPALTDNFEGLAAQTLDSGDLRLWIVSDDNFSNLQRTLLYAFDVTPAPGAE